MNHQKFLQVNKLLKNIPETALKLHKRIHIYQNDKQANKQTRKH